MGVLLAEAGLWAAPAQASASPGAIAKDEATLKVVASGLNEPNDVTIGANGDIYVAEAGNGRVGAAGKTGAEKACANDSGAIARITPGGKVTTIVYEAPRGLDLDKQERDPHHTGRGRPEVPARPGRRQGRVDPHEQLRHLPAVGGPIPGLSGELVQLG